MNYLKGLFLLMWSLFLTMVTVVFGVIPLQGLRLLCGSSLFVAINIAVMLVFYGLGQREFVFLYSCNWLLVAFYNELRLRKHSVFTSGSLSVLGLTVFQALIAFQWIHSNPNWLATITNYVDKVMTDYAVLNPQAAELVSASELVSRLPGMAVIISIVMMFFIILFERKVAHWMLIENKLPEFRMSDFAVPEFFIWVFIASLLGAFYKSNLPMLQMVAQNTLYVCLVVYFFQGLAIVSRFFEVFNVGTLWRALWLTILVIQLFLLLSVIGVIDYWVSFRTRFEKRATELKKKSF